MKKLDYRYLGPFKVIKQRGKQAYELDLPTGMGRVHNMFYVSLLEPYHKRPGHEPPTIADRIVGEDEFYEIEKILA